MDWAVDGIAARGPAYGVHVVLTVTQSMQVRVGGTEQAFGGRIEVRLGDVFDSEFGRDLMKQIPADTPGRGLSDIGGAHHFHAALPTGDPEADPTDLQTMLASWVTRLNERWPDRQVSRVQTLPETGSLDQARPQRPQPLGGPGGVLRAQPRHRDRRLQRDRPAPVGLRRQPDRQEHPAAHTRQGLVAGKSTDEVGIVFIDHRRSLMGCIPDEYQVAYGMSSDQSSSIAASITQSLRERMPGPDVTAEQLARPQLVDRVGAVHRDRRLRPRVDDERQSAAAVRRPRRAGVGPRLPPHHQPARRRPRAGHARAAAAAAGGHLHPRPPVRRRSPWRAAWSMAWGLDRLPEGRALFVSRDGRSSQIQVGRPREDS